MSTQFLGVDPGAHAARPDNPPPPAPGPGGDLGAGAPPGPPSPPRRSFWLRPWGIVTIVALALTLSVMVIVGFLVVGVAGSSTPLRPVMVDDFAVAGDRPMQVDEGLSWDQSGGTLNVYPTEKGPQLLYFELPQGAGAMRVEATLVQPAFDDQASLLWGIATYDASTSKGVALLCSAGGTMFLADATTAEPLPMGGSDVPCTREVSMVLEVRGSTVMYGPVDGDLTMYIGDVRYGGLDSVAVVISADKPDQVVKVPKISAYQP